MWLVVRMLRRRLAGAAALGLVGAVLFGGSLAAFAGARRSDRALDRFLVYSKAEDVFVEPSPDAPLDMAAVDRLPQVTAAGYQSYLAMVPVDDDGHPELAAVGTINPYLRTPVSGPPDAILRRRVIRGRDLDPSAPDEAVVDEELAAARHLGPGDRLRMATYSASQMPSLFTGPEVPAPMGPVVDLLITGVVRTPVDVAPAADTGILTFGGTKELYLSPAFYPAFGRELAVFGPPEPGSGQGLLLRNGATDRPGFEAAVRALPGGDQANIAIGGSDSLDAARSARRAIAVETVSLLALGVALAAAGVALLGQGLARLARNAGDTLRSLRALGVRPVQLVLVAAAPGMLAVAMAAVGAVLVAILASPFTPIGLGRLADVSPGLRLDGIVLGLGGVGLLLVGLISSGVAALPAVRSLSARSVERSSRPSWLAGSVAALGAPLAVTLGARFAVELPGQRRAPLRYGAAVSALALLVVAGVTTYTSNLDHLVTHHEQQGATWDLTLGNPNSSDFTEDDVARLMADPSVAGVSAVVSPEGRASVDGTEVAIAGLDELRGAVGPDPRIGRMPTASGEVALGLRTAARLHARVGDTVTVSLNGNQVRMEVVGTATLNPGLAFTMEIGGGAIVTVEQLQDLVPGQPVNILLARVAPQVSIDDAIASLSQGFTNVSRPAPAVEVVNLDRTRALPIALAGAMAAAALALLTAALVTSARERRRELGVLRALGATRRQVGTVLVWQGLWLYMAALVGIPIGVAAGRILWDGIAQRLGLLAAPDVPFAALGRVAAIGLVLSLLLAAGQALLAVRGSPAHGLRTE